MHEGDGYDDRLKQGLKRERERNQDGRKSNGQEEPKRRGCHKVKHQSRGSEVIWGCRRPSERAAKMRRVRRTARTACGNHGGSVELDNGCGKEGSENSLLLCRRSLHLM